MDQSLTENGSITGQALSKVPQITAFFWITKVLTTGMGETFSDFLVHLSHPVVPVALAGLVLIGSLILQFSVKRYIAWIYWLCVVMISIVGTMVADVLHHGLGIPYSISTAFFLVALAVILTVWYAFEKTLSIHSIYTRRRELFYWITVLVTFSLGTAAGDLTATTMNLGYFSSGVLFAVLIALPALAYGLFHLNEIFTFWFAYIVTRPLGASFSDWIAVAHSRGGLGLGTGPVSLFLTVVIFCLVGYLSFTRRDAQNILQA